MIINIIIIRVICYPSIMLVKSVSPQLFYSILPFGYHIPNHLNPFATSDATSDRNSTSTIPVYMFYVVYGDRRIW